jgi:hypothetical protein
MEAADEELKAKQRGAGKRPEDMEPEELQELLEQGLAAMIERGEVNLPFDVALPESSVQDIL